MASGIEMMLSSLVQKLTGMSLEQLKTTMEQAGIQSAETMRKFAVNLDEQAAAMRRIELTQALILQQQAMLLRRYSFDTQDAEIIILTGVENDRVNGTNASGDEWTGTTGTDG